MADARTVKGRINWLRGGDSLKLRNNYASCGTVNNNNNNTGRTSHKH
jgi:hypothetical protein